LRSLGLTENCCSHLAFEKLFGDTELLDRVNREASANNGKSDCRITLSDGRAFWVETIPMDGGWLVSAYDMRERSAKERIDTLTKLGNRLMFHERLAEMLAKPDRAVEATAVLVLDLARFKAINESLGRTIGGALLGSVADRIRAILRPGSVATSSASSRAVKASRNRRLRLLASCSI
jgi:GGDEF domain-containing protein